MSNTNGMKPFFELRSAALPSETMSLVRCPMSWDSVREESPEVCSDAACSEASVGKEAGLAVLVVGTAVVGVAVDGVAVDGVAVDGVAVDGVAVVGVAVDGIAVIGVADDGYVVEICSQSLPLYPGGQTHLALSLRSNRHRPREQGIKQSKWGLLKRWGFAAP